MKFRPCIDIHKGKVKQIVGFTLNSRNQNLQTNFVAKKSAAYFANLYKEDDLKGGHLIMLDDDPATKKEAMKALKTFPQCLQIGGGITKANAQSYLDGGAIQVIVSSYIFTDNKLDKAKLEELSRTIEKKRLVLDLSCRKKNNKYVVVKDKWQTFTDLTVNVDDLKMLSLYCDEFLVHGVDCEGKRQGIEIDLLEILSRFSAVPITYAGGIKNYTDIDLIYKIGKGKVDFTVGSALDIFGGEMKYEEVVKLSTKSQYPNSK